MIKKYSEEKRQEVIEARKDGATIAQIAVMTGVGQTTVKAWLKNGSSGDFQDLGDTYMFKEALRSIYRQAKDSYHARIAFYRWCKLAEETGIPELKTMARTIRDKLDGIVTYWTFRHISNAKMEGFNNKIRWLIKHALRFKRS